MKHFIFFLFGFLSIPALAQYNCQELKSVLATSGASIDNNAKSDTIDILHYDISLDATEVTSKQLKGSTAITFTPKMSNVNHMALDLLKLTIDSIEPASLVSGYTYNDTIISLNFNSSVDPSDTLTVVIHYHGSPQGDPTGWGGWHHNAPYYYNLGVGFGADPHTYGRAWFPCFDNFVEKSTYSFKVTTEGGRKAYCNGLRTNLQVINADTIASYWEMTDPIPTYLASVAISNYEELNSTHNGIPVMLVARANDTTKLKNSFINLLPTLDAYIDYFGPYVWQKVGYAATTVGAMEHSTSIHYPIGLIQGNTNGEDIMAHELSHHWWGNLITCETDAHMWINEGMAEFSSHLYEEQVYSKEKYIETVQDNGAWVIQFANISDGGFFSLVNLPHSLTYGKHTYQKGAMVAHNLRGYLGDSLFFYGTKKLLSDFAFQNINSIEFRDEMENNTGYDLTSFFDDWIFNPGFPQFGIDSIKVTPMATMEYKTDITIRQGLRGTQKRFSNIPLKITYHGSNGLVDTRDFMFGHSDTTFSSLLFFDPSYITINEEQHILTGTTVNEETITQTGQIDFDRALFKIDVQSVPDTALFRVEHNWAGPGGKNPNNYKISKNRYWRITGNIPTGFDATGEMIFSRLTNQGNLDSDLLTNGEDSLILLYRHTGMDPWLEYPYYNKNVLNNPSNGYGKMELSKVLKGEYVFANGESTLSQEDLSKVISKVLIYPNPTDHSLKIELKSKRNRQLNYRVYDQSGRIVQQGVWDLNKGKNNREIHTYELSSGQYILDLDGHKESFQVIN